MRSPQFWERRRRTRDGPDLDAQNGQELIDVQGFQCYEPFDIHLVAEKHVVCTWIPFDGHRSAPLPFLPHLIPGFALSTEGVNLHIQYG